MKENSEIVSDFFLTQIKIFHGFHYGWPRCYWERHSFLLSNLHVLMDFVHFVLLI